MANRSRSLKSHSRRSPKKVPRSNTLIVCEGEKTERIYFQDLKNDLRLTTVEVEIIGEGGAPSTVVERATRKRDERKKKAKRNIYTSEYDSIWCVFDIERPGQIHRLDDVINRAKANNFNLAMSNPAFELWYLIHFEPGGKPYHDCADITSDLKNYIPNYSKSESIYNTLSPHTDKAIANSRNLLNNRWNGKNSEIKDCNPSTRVHRLVLHLKGISNFSSDLLDT